MMKSYLNTSVKTIVLMVILIIANSANIIPINERYLCSAQEDDALDNNGIKHEKYISYFNYIIHDQDEYVTISLNQQSSFLYSPGKPLIPKITNTFTFPLGTVITNIDVDVKTQPVLLQKKIQTAPFPVLSSWVTVENVFSQNSAITQSFDKNSSLFPSVLYTIHKGAGLYDNDRVLFLKVDCYAQYSSGNDIIYLPEKSEIEISYKLPECTVFAADEYDLLIITDEQFTTDLQPLVDHKNNINVKTMMETVQNIYPRYDGRDDAEDVKLFIKDAIEEYDIKYVLLAGGRKGQTLDWYVPSRRTNNDVSNIEPGYESDLYFSDVYRIEDDELVFEDWDSNGNNIFAEWDKDANETDTMDYYPDVHVGRIPFRYQFEVTPVVNKIIEYETNADDSWFKNALVVAGDTFPPSKGAPVDHIFEGEVETNVTATLLESSGFDVERLWLSLDAWDDSRDVITALNQGHGFVHFSGHGDPAEWGTYPPDDIENEVHKGLSIFKMNKLRNDGKLPIVVVGGCHNAQFNVTLANLPKLIDRYGILYAFLSMEWVPRDFCSWLVLQRTGGAIATIGNTGLGPMLIGEHGDIDLDNVSEPDCIEAYGGWIETRFFENYVNQKITVLGDVHDQTIIDYINQIGNVDSYPEVGDIDEDPVGRCAIEEWVLIGDPSLHIGGI